MGLLIITREGYAKLVVEGDSQVIIMMLKRMQEGYAIIQISNCCHLEGGLECLQAITPSIEVIVPSHIRKSTKKKLLIALLMKESHVEKKCSIDD